MQGGKLANTILLMNQNPYTVGRSAPAASHAPPPTSVDSMMAPLSSSVAPSTALEMTKETTDTFRTAPSTASAAKTAFAGVESNNNNSTSSSSSSKTIALRQRVNQLLNTPVNQDLKELVDYLQLLTPMTTSSSSPQSQSSMTTTTMMSNVVGKESESSRSGNARSGGGMAGMAPGTVSRKTATTTTTMTTMPSTTPALAATNTRSNTSHVPSTPQALRSLLETRALSIHKEYLAEYATLYDAFKAASSSVQHVHEQAVELSRVTSARAAETEKLVLQFTTLQAELEMVRQREESVRQFNQKFLFDAEAQRTLEKDPITPAYLDVLDRARAVHQKSRVLLAAYDGHDSTHATSGSRGNAESGDVARMRSANTLNANAAATAVMESTYTAIVHATTRVARFVNTALSSTPAAWTDGGSGGGGGGSHPSSLNNTRERVLLRNATSDEPDITAFLLRCLHLLRHEDVPHWEQVMEEVARLRRASVLRQYHHLLSSAGGPLNAQSGSYHGSQTTHSHNTNTPITSHAARPLEAEVDDPLFFFSSLFAWLHQTIVTEKGFLHRIWTASEHADDVVTAADATADSTGAGKEIDTNNHNNHNNSSDVSRRSGDSSVAQPLATTTLTESTLLSTVFSGVCKPIASSVEGVLLRLSRQITTATPYLAPSNNSNNNNNTGVNPSNATSSPLASAAFSGGKDTNVQQQDVSAGHGPRGLTGRLTKLLQAATGKSMQPKRFQEGGGSGSGSGSGGWGAYGQTSTRFAPYAAVHTRDQQEATTSALLDDVVRGVQTCFALLQLVEYYSMATFEPLLGSEAELTVYMRTTAMTTISQSYDSLSELLVRHWLDSVSAAVTRQPVLRRLASAAATERGDSNSSPSASKEVTATTTGVEVEAGSTLGRSPSRFVLEYLFMHQGASDSSAEAGPADDVAIYSGNAEQVARRTAFDLVRALKTLILPPSPEIALCVQSLATLVAARAQQETVLSSIAEASGARASSTLVDTKEALIRSVSERSLVLAHAIVHFAGFLSSSTSSDRPTYITTTTTATTTTHGEHESEKEDDAVRAALTLPPTLASLRDRETYAPVVSALDDVCKAVMCINTYRVALTALRAAAAAASSSSASSASSASASGPVRGVGAEARAAADSSTYHYVLTQLQSTCTQMEKVWHGARQTLLSLLAQSAAECYFGSFLQLMRMRHGGGGSGGAQEEDQSSSSSSTQRSFSQRGFKAFSAFPPELLQRIAEKRATDAQGHGVDDTVANATNATALVEQRLTKTVLADLYDFYNRVAATGVMPPVPLLDAVLDEKDRAALSRELLQRVADQYAQVYDELHNLVVSPSQQTQTEIVAGEAVPSDVGSEGRLVLQPGEWAAFEDMEPRKLRLLIG